MKVNRKFLSLLITTLLLLTMIAPVSASMSPTTLIAELAPGESITETKTVEIPEVPPRADVVFAFDLTYSMSGIISTAKTRAEEIMTGLAAIPDVDIQFGVMSYMDYPGVYSSCDYATTYGVAGSDYAYSLDQPITSDTSAVSFAINGLTLGNGADGPEDYTRIFYESYADAAVSWRSGAKRILLNFADSVPHDCDLNEGVPGTSGTWSTGCDPGRDETVLTGDDLDLQTVLSEMATSGVVLLEAHTTTAYNTHWQYWTGLTGGNVFTTGSGTLVDDIISEVTAALVVPSVSDLHLEASPGYEGWLTAVTPSSYPSVTPGDEVTFDITITVPEGTEDGVYTFTISALDAVGVSYGDQEVTITVVSTIPVSVDIHPSSCPNPFNVDKKGVLPVAIMGLEDFDVTQIDPASVRLAGVAPLRWSFEDAGIPYEPFIGKEGIYDCIEYTDDYGIFDGYLDLTLKFNAQEVAAALGEVNDGDVLVLTLTGNLREEFGGTPIIGEDVVWILAK